MIGNTVRRARWDGIETVGSSTRTTVVRNKIYDTRTGIYIEHSTHRSTIARNLIVDALVGINVEWWHEGAGSRRNTFAFNRIVRSRAGIVVDVGGDRNRIVGNVFVGGPADRRSSCRARRTTSCVTMSAAGAGATRSSSSPRPGTTTGGGPCRGSTNSTATRTRPRRAEGPPRAGPGGGRLGAPLLVEDRGQRGLLRRGADPRSCARAYRPRDDRLHHGDRARGRPPGGAGDHGGDDRFRRPPGRGARRAAHERRRVPVRERLADGGRGMRRADRSSATRGRPGSALRSSPSSSPRRSSLRWEMPATASCSAAAA